MTYLNSLSVARWLKCLIDLFQHSFKTFLHDTCLFTSIDNIGKEAPPYLCFCPCYELRRLRKIFTKMFFFVRAMSQYFVRQCRLCEETKSNLSQAGWQAGTCWSSQPPSGFCCWRSWRIARKRATRRSAAASWASACSRRAVSATWSPAPVARNAFRAWATCMTSAARA